MSVPGEPAAADRNLALQKGPRLHSLVSLVGLPGSGKSTIGRQIARRLQWSFVDVDAAIEKRLGQTIRTYFEQVGEAEFRDLEAEVLGELCQQSRTVIATGGGAVLRAENRACLRTLTHVIYLRAHPDEIWRRLRHDTVRPLLQVDDPQTRIRDLYAQRDPLYREVAEFVSDTGRPSVASLANAAVMQLELAGIVGAETRPPAAPEVP